MGFITYNCINISQRSYLKKVKMQNKQSTLSDFQVLNKLGEGAFGQVFKVKRNLDGKEYALKKVFHFISSRLNLSAWNQRKETTLSTKSAFLPPMKAKISSVTRKPFLMKYLTHYASSWRLPHKEIYSKKYNNMPRNKLKSQKTKSGKH